MREPLLLKQILGHLTTWYTVMTAGRRHKMDQSCQTSHQVTLFKVKCTNLRSFTKVKSLVKLGINTYNTARFLDQVLESLSTIKVKLKG
jgi:hypothetical protein